jgi:hypothetical protein
VPKIHSNNDIKDRIQNHSKFQQCVWYSMTLKTRI